MRIVEVSDEHEPSWWCWCRPKVMNRGDEMVIQHRNLSSEFLNTRKFSGGEPFESNGQGAEWRNVYP